MIEVIPAILPRDYDDLKNKLAFVRGHAPVVQIDICDGNFVKNTTWPFFAKASKGTALSEYLDEHFLRILNEREGLPFWEDIDFELDLMVSNFIENFDIYVALGPRRMVFHFESVEDHTRLFDFIEGIDMYVKEAIEFGVAINTTTNVEEIFPILSHVDFVQVMGIENVGFQGQEFDERCLEQIKKIKEKFVDLVISVDGGVTLQTAPKLIQAGATRLVAGSAIFNTDDIIDSIEKFKEL